MNDDRKIKTTFNIKRIIRAGAIGLVFIFTTVFSLIPVGFDIVKAVKDPYYWGNFAFLVMLTIFGMFIGEGEGNDYFKGRINGLYQTIKEMFDSTVKKIYDDCYRSFYADWLADYNDRKRNKIYTELMLNERVPKSMLGVINIPEEEFMKLFKGEIVKYNEVKYRLSPNQYELVDNIRQGKVKITFIVNDCYFLTTDGDARSDVDEQLKNSENNKKATRNKLWLGRLALLGLFAVIFAGLFVGDAEKGISKPENWYYLLVRLFSLSTALFCGLTVASAINKIDIFVLRAKHDRNKEFYESISTGRYKPADIQTKLEAEYEEQEKRKEEVEVICNPQIEMKGDM